MKSKNYNFSAGPAALPFEVEQALSEAVLDYQGSGIPIGSLGHRTELFGEIAEKSEALLRELLAISQEYAVLFLHGGASHQFAMVPMNLLRGKDSADYLVTGTWSQKAQSEASRYCQAHIAAQLDEKAAILALPEPETWQLNSEAAYVYYTPNETIHGVQFHQPPNVGGVPLVADATSMLLSAPMDIERFGLIFAGAQKNIGIAGLTVVIVRRDLLGHELPMTPTLYSYAHHDQQQSLSNTSPVVAWYTTYLMLQWVAQQGDLASIAENNRKQASQLYDLIDRSALYTNQVRPCDRSDMNVVFALKNKALEPEFLRQAERAGLKGLKGHRSIGGMRASLYNAMPQAGVDRLVSFMHEFEQTHL